MSGLYDKVDQPVGHHDHLFHLRPFKRTLHFVGCERKTFQISTGRAFRDGQGIAQLAFDLNGDGDLVIDQQRGIDGGPCGVGDQPFTGGGKGTSARCGIIGATRSSRAETASCLSRLGEAFSMAFVKA